MFIRSHPWKPVAATEGHGSQLSQAIHLSLASFGCFLFTFCTQSHANHVLLTTVTVSIPLLNLCLSQQALRCTTDKIINLSQGLQFTLYIHVYAYIHIYLLCILHTVIMCVSKYIILAYTVWQCNWLSKISYSLLLNIYIFFLKW